MTEEMRAFKISRKEERRPYVGRRAAVRCRPRAALQHPPERAAEPRVSARMLSRRTLVRLRQVNSLEDADQAQLSDSRQVRGAGRDEDDHEVEDAPPVAEEGPDPVAGQVDVKQYLLSKGIFSGSYRQGHA